MKTLTLITAMALLTGCAAKPETTMSNEEPKAQAAQAVASSDNGLKMTDSVVGSGAEAVAGKTISVHYTGRLITGRKFDSSLDRNEPFKFKLGAGQVIKGWDQGFAGMKVGGKRQLTIPPDMGYGAAGAGGVIPPNATLVFDVELLGVEE